MQQRNSNESAKPVSRGIPVTVWYFTAYSVHLLQGLCSSFFAAETKRRAASVTDSSEFQMALVLVGKILLWSSWHTVFQHSCSSRFSLSLRNPTCCCYCLTEKSHLLQKVTQGHFFQKYVYEHYIDELHNLEKYCIVAEILLKMSHFSQ